MGEDEDADPLAPPKVEEEPVQEAPKPSIAPAKAAVPPKAKKHHMLSAPSMFSSSAPKKKSKMLSSVRAAKKADKRGAQKEDREHLNVGSLMGNLIHTDKKKPVKKAKTAHSMLLPKRKHKKATHHESVGPASWGLGSVHSKAKKKAASKPAAKATPKAAPKKAVHHEKLVGGLKLPKESAPSTVKSHNAHMMIGGLSALKSGKLPKVAPKGAKVAKAPKAPKGGAKKAVKKVKKPHVKTKEELEEEKERKEEEDDDDVPAAAPTEDLDAFSFGPKPGNTAQASGLLDRMVGGDDAVAAGGFGLPSAAPTNPLDRFGSF